MQGTSHEYSTFCSALHSDPYYRDSIFAPVSIYSFVSKRDTLRIVQWFYDVNLPVDGWRIFKQRHAWDLLAGLFKSRPQDRALGYEIFGGTSPKRFFVSKSRRITTSLILKSGLLSRTEMTLLASREDEGWLWIVLENILDVVNPVKLESATGGE
jgi:hypothetical protein